MGAKWALLGGGWFCRIRPIWPRGKRQPERLDAGRADYRGEAARADEISNLRREFPGTAAGLGGSPAPTRRPVDEWALLIERRWVRQLAGNCSRGWRNPKGLAKLSVRVWRISETDTSRLGRFGEESGGKWAAELAPAVVYGTRESAIRRAAPRTMGTFARRRPSSIDWRLLSPLRVYSSEQTIFNQAPTAGRLCPLRGAGAVSADPAADRSDPPGSHSCNPCRSITRQAYTYSYRRLRRLFDADRPIRPVAAAAAAAESTQSHLNVNGVAAARIRELHPAGPEEQCAQTNWTASRQVAAAQSRPWWAGLLEAP